LSGDKVKQRVNDYSAVCGLILWLLNPYRAGLEELGSAPFSQTQSNQNWVAWNCIGAIYIYIYIYFSQPGLGPKIGGFVLFCWTRFRAFVRLRLVQWVVQPTFSSFLLLSQLRSKVGLVAACWVQHDQMLSGDD